jgi:hypothetical protein
MGLGWVSLFAIPVSELKPEFMPLSLVLALVLLDLLTVLIGEREVCGVQRVT